MTFKVVPICSECFEQHVIRDPQATDPDVRGCTVALERAAQLVLDRQPERNRRSRERARDFASAAC
jgi:hypothetical protein